MPGLPILLENLKQITYHGSIVFKGVSGVEGKLPMTTLLKLIYPDLHQAALVHLYHLACEPVEPVLLHYHLQDGQYILQNCQYDRLWTVLMEDFIQPIWSPLNPYSKVSRAAVAIWQDDFGSVWQWVDCPRFVEIENVWRVDWNAVHAELLACVDVDEEGFVILDAFYPLSLTEPGEKVVASSLWMHNMFNSPK